MSDAPYTGLRYDEMPTLWDGFANLVRPGLGLTAFGANVMNLPPDYETKAHDRVRERPGGALRRAGGLGRGPHRRGARARAARHRARRPRRAATSRILASGPGGMRVLIIGGVPGKAYVAPEWSSGED